MLRNWTANSLLQELGGLDEDNRLTDVGRGLAKLPLDSGDGDYKRADEEILYEIGGVKIQVGQIRLARRLLGLPGSERSV